MGRVCGLDRAADGALLGVQDQRRDAARDLGGAPRARRSSAGKPELRFPHAGLDRLRLRRPGPPRDDESALVHCDRPHRAVARGRVRKPPAVSRRDRRAGVALRARDRRRAPRRLGDRSGDRDRSHCQGSACPCGGRRGRGVTSLRARLARKPPGYQFTIGRILAIYSGLMVTLLLAALDQTIVATALPKVVSDLGGISQYSWVFTAYVLGSTVTVPLYGKLGDVHGRKPLFFVAISIFIVGSALCGLAQNMTELVVFRAIQGIGAGGIFPLTIAMVGLIIPPRDRGRYQGLIGAVFAAASIVGPLVGGLIVDNFSWRWVFYVNLPVGVLALAVVYVTMPRRRERHEHSIDWLGAGVLAAGTTALLLGLVWGGRDYSWTSAHVVGALATAAGLLAMFALVEMRVPEPILPFGLLRNQTVSASVACMALVGMAMFGTISFVPLFVQGVIGTSATSSGVV